MKGRITKSKRFWVTQIVCFSILPALYYAISKDMDGVATIIALGQFASQGIYVHNETKNPSKKADEHQEISEG